MNIRNILLLLTAAFLHSCTDKVKNPDVKAAIAADTLKYHYENLKKRAGDCGSKPDSACTVISVKYPIFDGQTPLNDSVRRWAMDTTFDIAASQFIKLYQIDKKTNTRKMFFTSTAAVSVIRQDSSLISLQLDKYSYTGGAHGSSFTGFLNWDTKHQKKLALKDVLISGYPERLTRVADTIFRKQENLSDTSSLANDYFFKDAKFALNNNVLMSPVGLRFIYNQYEIKPYAAGQTDLLIPYSKIRSLVKPHTVIAQYLK